MLGVPVPDAAYSSMACLPRWRHFHATTGAHLLRMSVSTAISTLQDPICVCAHVPIGARSRTHATLTVRACRYEETNSMENSLFPTCRRPDSGLRATLRSDAGLY